MGQEIERKFLVNAAQWQQAEKPVGERYRQGYLLLDPHKTIRVRLTPTKGFLTIKGKSTGATRAEFEYEIPMEEASALLDQFAIAELSKIRYTLTYQDKVWEIDEFLGDNAGLIVAEIELESEDESFERPAWVTEEVTTDARYYNANLTTRPYNRW
ncbi:CYTH domain-containing protein [Chitinophaga polysaccharea]|uniref:CYTH domain-containing protein n=1 Tax=Chitinophaga TaxID=79328 RepID=UPI0014559359|nr:MULTISPECIES: CYTH domain-containing protein [Chitinophaga]NLR58631.1 CYTH domain-containing protein [Chitinophaga polysaccharea]NLU91159.1 CYTH domain-containing protein [Chitinophaga sp. Ak27]